MLFPYTIFLERNLKQERRGHMCINFYWLILSKNIIDFSQKKIVAMFNLSFLSFVEFFFFLQISNRTILCFMALLKMKLFLFTNVLYGCTCEQKFVILHIYSLFNRAFIINSYIFFRRIGIEFTSHYKCQIRKLYYQF